MPHDDKRLNEAAQKSRLKMFILALETVKKFGFATGEVAGLINVHPRSIFRILEESRAISYEELLQLQVAAMTLLKLQTKMLKNQRLDPRKVTS